MLNFNKELFNQKTELDKLKQDQAIIKRQLVELTAKEEEISKKIPLKEREILSIEQRVRVDLNNRIQRINSIINPKFKSSLDDKLNIHISQVVPTNGVSRLVWVLSINDDGDYVVNNEESSLLPESLEDQLFLFSRFQQIINFLK